MTGGSGGINAKRLSRTTTRLGTYDGYPGTLPSSNAGQTQISLTAGGGATKGSFVRSYRFNQSNTSTGNYYSGRHFINHPFDVYKNPNNYYGFSLYR
uniref:Uncharacterized protein n=1 Tax=viral metagenome TaxID=1070528 RepID=A0A6C0H620_9ZZZZ